MAMRLPAVALLLLCAGGCASWPLSSKWAMKNADYAAKYDRPYPKREVKRYARMTKQAIDARHVEGMAGFYGTVAATGEAPAASGEFGFAHYPTSWLEIHGGFAGLAGVDRNPEKLGDMLYLGANGGARVGSPTRIAPFVGVGAFAGVSTYDVVRLALEDEEDPFEDPEDSRLRMAGAVYPEVGVHFWATSRLRLTGSAAYYVTTEGRGHDFWFFGVTLGSFTEPHFYSDATSGDEPDIDWAPPQRAAELSRLPPPPT